MHRGKSGWILNDFTRGILHFNSRLFLTCLCACPLPRRTLLSESSGHDTDMIYLGQDPRELRSESLAMDGATLKIDMQNSHEEVNTAD